MSIETLFAGILNANNRFAAAAGAPIFLNLSIVTTLLLTPFFADAGHAAAWGVLAAGVVIVLVVGGDAETHGIGIRLRMPRLDGPTRRFLKALGPAIIGAGGVQLALFADTLIASYLPTGALSALYYADRINQLPIGVVGIAVGTVLLPEMSRRLAAGDEKGAASAQARGIQLALLLTIPCAAGAIVIPDLIMRALFARGAFTVADAAAAGATLAAYSIGLLPFVLLRSFTAPFYARGDTATPVKAALLAAAINILLKVLLMGHFAQVGLALATSVGAWINLSLLALFARRQGFAVSGAAIGKPVAKLIAAGVMLAAALLAGSYGLERALAGMAHFREETMLALLLVDGHCRLWPDGLRAARAALAEEPVARGDRRRRYEGAARRSSSPTPPTTPPRCRTTSRHREFSYPAREIDELDGSRVDRRARERSPRHGRSAPANRWRRSAWRGRRRLVQPRCQGPRRQAPPPRRQPWSRPNRPAPPCRRWSL